MVADKLTQIEPGVRQEIYLSSGPTKSVQKVRLPPQNSADRMTMCARRAR